MSYISDLNAAEVEKYGDVEKRTGWHDVAMAPLTTVQRDTLIAIAQLGGEVATLSDYEDRVSDDGAAAALRWLVAVGLAFEMPSGNVKLTEDGWRRVDEFGASRKLTSRIPTMVRVGRWPDGEGWV